MKGHSFYPHAVLSYKRDAYRTKSNGNYGVHEYF